MKAISALVFAAMAATSSCAAPPEGPDSLVPAVTELDLRRFEGTWFELSRIPIPIARDWVNTADIYIHNPDGSWKVRYEGNKGYGGGERKVLKQKLRIPDPMRPGEMEVSMIPFVWMKYRLVYMSADYRFMLVTSSSKRYLWVMSRLAQPTEAEYADLVSTAATLGFDTSKLERVPQGKVR